jgi:CO dehydrogenase/acetyl-CoA synthase delta subunit
MNDNLVLCKFAQLVEGEFFYLSNNNESIKCEKLSNNLAEDENYNIILLSSTDVVCVEICE